MAVSCSGRGSGRGGSTRQFPPPLTPTTTPAIYIFFKYILQFGQINFRIKTNTLSYLDKYILHPAIPTTADAHHYTSTLCFLQICFEVWTNTFHNRHKYNFRLGQIHFAPAIPTTAYVHHYTSTLYFLQIYFEVWTNYF